MNKKKPAICILLAALLLSSALLIHPIAAEETGYQNITVQQAQQMIKQDKGDLVILDVRNQSEYNLGHLYDAVLVPVYEIENSSIPISLSPPLIDNSLLMDVYTRTENAFKLSDHINDNIVIYCSAGGRSAQACQILIDQGFTNVYNMLGGINAWMQADYPIYTSSHHITIDYNDQALLDIQPLLQYQTNCDSCQNQPNEDSYIPSIEVTKTLLEESENHTLYEVSENIDGVVTEYTVDKTLLWCHTEAKKNFNRTIHLLQS